MDQDGFVYITGRLKRIYPTRADNGDIYRIFPQRIEELFETQPQIAGCAVAVIGDEKCLNVPVAFVVLADDAVLDRQKVIADLRDISGKELSTHMQPREIRIVDEIPLTPSGKTDYQKLDEMAENKVRLSENLHL